MKRAERERLIERYLSGAMSPSEEQDFFIEVAADRELRTELKAYQIVESAVGKDRRADGATYASLRTHMMGVIAGTALPGSNGAGSASHAQSGSASGAASGSVSGSVSGSAASAASSSAAASPASAVAGGSGALGSLGLIGSVWLKWLIVAGAASALAAGALVLFPSARPGPDRVADSSRVHHTTSPPAPGPAGAPASSSSSTAEAPVGVSMAPPAAPPDRPGSASEIASPNAAAAAAAKEENGHGAVTRTRSATERQSVADAGRNRKMNNRAPRAKDAEATNRQSKLRFFIDEPRKE